MTWDAYGEGLEPRLRDLHDRIHRGAYRAKPSRRVFIAKSNGRQRPPGIAVLEDKIVQRALIEVLNAIWEEDFLGLSHGFRPGRGQHDALDALAVGIRRYKVNWILDADIAGFFDTVDHDWLIRFVEHRVGDRRGDPPDPRMAEGRGDGRRGGDTGNGGHAARRGDLAVTGESTCTTSSIRGRTNGGSAMPRETSSSRATLTTSSLALSTRPRPCGSWRTCASDWRSSR